MSPSHLPPSTDYISTFIFAIDMGMKFLLAYTDDEKGLVTDHKTIALNYMRSVVVQGMPS